MLPARLSLRGCSLFDELTDIGRAAVLRCDPVPPPSNPDPNPLDWLLTLIADIGLASFPEVV